MCAAASKDCPWARSWQSQRVTRRSFGAPGADETVFQPVPSHTGQTLAGALITGPFQVQDNPFLLSNQIYFAPTHQLRASPNARPSVYILLRSSGVCGGPRKTGP